jgi:Pro-kumamolisin, activation domain/CARDB
MECSYVAGLAVRLARAALAHVIVAIVAFLAFVPSEGAAASSPVATRFASVLVSQVPTPVSTGKAPRIGALSPDTRLQLALNLPLRNQADLDQLLLELYDPHSPNYHQYLSVDQFTERFGPTESDYASVVNWARGNGLRVTHTAPNRHIVDVEASVVAINKAFGIVETQYRDDAHHRTFHAPDREPTVTGLAIPLLFVDGLDDYSLPRTGIERSQAPSSANGSGPNGSYLPSDIRTAYYGNGSLAGAGQTVAIFSLNGYHDSDLQTYFQYTNTTQTVPVNNVLVNDFSGDCTVVASNPVCQQCDDAEQILDIVNVMGMAPGLSQILFYEGTLATDILNVIAADNTAKTITSSWAGSNFGSAGPIFQEFAAQGQTYVNATGDGGSGSFSLLGYSAPRADPYVLQVGGTELATAGAGGAWASESGWPGSGGGYLLFGPSIPVWQVSAINVANQGSTSWRNSPDVAAEANTDNPGICNGQPASTYGGTSIAAPRWGGFIALANQQSVANGNGTVGFINPRLYGLAGNGFHDITSGSNGDFSAVAGYDLVTGLGSPKPVLIQLLAGSAVDDLFRSGFEATPSLPNLVPYRPTGWSDKIVVSNITGTSTDTGLLLPTDSLYVDWAVRNDGSVATGLPIDTDLYVDGAQVQSWELGTPLGPLYYEYVTDWSIGSLNAGPHTLEIVARYSGAESNIADNTYSRTVRISGPNLTPYQPAGWSDKLVVSNMDGSTTDSGFLLSTDTLYISWAVINDGIAATANPFDVYLYIDGSVYDHFWTMSMPAYVSQYGYVTSFSIGSLGAGSHVLELYADPTNVIPEMNESDNTYSKMITVH